ncbi:MFS transporter [Nonomuraea sp. NPDC049152]|uniref:MFS transporter n=1 Tax=Nonomuraea sp. NPDC049152 TaxID=3154350 RepID=UPI0033C3A94B
MSTLTLTRPVAFAPTLTVFVLTALLVSGQLYVVIPLLHDMAVGWRSDQSALTWLVTAFAIGYGLGFLLFGPLSDQYGRRRLLLIGMPVAAAATALVAVSPNPAVAIALRFVQGIAVATFPPAGMAYLGESVEPRRRVVAISAITGAFLASAVLLQVAGQLTVDALGWRGLFVLSAAGFVAAAFGLRAVMIPDAPRERAASLASVYRAVPSLLMKPALVLRYLAVLVLLGGFVAVYTGLQLSGIVTSSAELLGLRAGGLPSILLVPLLTPWLARLSAPVRAILFLLLAAMVLAVTGATVPGAVGLAVLLALYVAAITAGLPALNESIAMLAEGSRGTALALFSFFLAVGSSLGPLAAAAFPGFDLLMYGLAGAMVIGALAVLASRVVAAGRRA